MHRVLITQEFPCTADALSHSLSYLLFTRSRERTGYYAGYVASSFTFGRILSGYLWGHFTDSFGRKPTVVVGLLSMQIFSLAFGLSTSYAQALSSR